MKEKKYFEENISMRGINSGVTFTTERLIILWRYDDDFIKTLMHECVHLMNEDVDEASTEAKALLLYTMYVSDSFDTFTSLFAKQIKKCEETRALYEMYPLSTKTNASLYLEGALTLIHPEEPARREKHAKSKTRVNYSVTYKAI